MSYKNVELKKMLEPKTEVIVLHKKAIKKRFP